MASINFPYYLNLVSGSVAEIATTFTTVTKIFESSAFIPTQSESQVNAWSSGANMNLARYRHGSTGSQSAALAVGGDTSTGNRQHCEKWNLNAWSVTGSTASERRAASGTQSAALTIGSGADTQGNVTSEKFNGTSWSLSQNLLQSHDDTRGLTGAQNASLALGGYSFINGEVNDQLNTSKYNGTAWSVSHAIAAPYDGAVAGTQNSALYVGYDRITRLYNGTAWSAGATRNTSAVGITGVRSAALAFGGINAAGNAFSNITEKFNGTTWSATGNLLAARYELGGSGGQNLALAFGGMGGTFGAGTFSLLTEKFTGVSIASTTAPKAFIVSDSERNDPSTEKRRVVPAGSALVLDPGPALSTANSFVSSTGAEFTDLTELSRIESVSASGGTAWTSGPALSTAHSAAQAGAGTQRAAIIVAGSTAPSGNGDFHIRTANCEKLVSGSWVSAGALSAAKTSHGVVGLQNATLSFGGYLSLTNGTLSSVTEFYNGTTWSTRANMTTAVSCAGSGTYGAALAVASANSQKWNGSAWSSIANPTSSFRPTGGQNATLSISGTLVTEKWNGTAWSLSHNLLTTQTSVSGSQNAAIGAGGSTAQVYSGTAWSMAGSPILARINNSQVGTPGSAMSLSGQANGTATGTHYNSTEFFTGSVNQAGYTRSIATAYPVTLNQG